MPTTRIEHSTSKPLPPLPQLGTVGPRVAGCAGVRPGYPEDMSNKIRGLVVTLTLQSVLVLLMAGCATSRINWDARVGNYTYDQAVEEMGPPDKQATLTDGNIVAEWITHRSSGGTSIGFGLGGGSYGGGSGMGAGVGVGQSLGGSASDRVLRLTFGTDKKLVSWSQN